MSAGGSVAIEIGGSAAGQFGRITINGAAHSASLRAPAALAGTLNLSAVNGFDPGFGSSFNVLTDTSHNGQFDTVNTFDAAQGTRGSIGNGKQFAVTYGASGLTVNTVAASPLPTPPPDTGFRARDPNPAAEGALRLGARAGKPVSHS